MENPEEYLDSHQIKYILHEHPAVFTCEEADRHCSDIPGLACKNLLLKNQKADRFFLIILPASKKADFKKIADLISEKKVTFANEKELKEKLGLTPGSVSPFGLINDLNNKVEVYLDRDIETAKTLGFHPNRNTATLEISGEMFIKFLQSLGNKVGSI